MKETANDPLSPMEAEDRMDAAGLKAEIERLKDQHNYLLAQKEAAIADLEDELHQFQKQSRVYKSELDEILKSKAWKLALAVRGLRLWIAPPNSPMEKLLGLTSVQSEMHSKIVGARHDPRTIAGLKEHHRTESHEKLLEFIDRKLPFHLRLAPHPELTILLVLYNQAELTYACLRSLSPEMGEHSEVLIIDNGCSDETGEMLNLIEGARVIRNTENLGFLRAVNQGVQAARGKYVLLLNNDTQVRRGSIRRALELIQSSPDIGAVGAKVMMLDGYLQEAGSFVWRDGSCQGYARGRHPQLDETMFQRDVDFVSGVFLLTPRDLFLEIGGFDERFIPAYYEDADYCMRLWERGYRVVYDPGVILDHYEYGSAGISEKALQQMRINQEKFTAKHAQALETHYLPAEQNLLFARTRRSSKARILFIDDLVPLPYHGSGLPRARAILQILVDLGYPVTFYPTAGASDTWEEVYKYIPETVEVMLNYNQRNLEHFLEARKGYYDILWVSRPTNARTINQLFNARPELFEDMLKISDAEAIWAMRDVEKARSLGKDYKPGQVDKLVSKEVGYSGFADRIAVVSESEGGYFRHKLQTDIRVLGHAVPIQPTPKQFDERANFLFVGRLAEEFSPNVDSVIWFIEQILPKVQKLIAAPVKISIVGKVKANRIERQENNPCVELVGPVDDLTPWYNNSRVFVAPTRFSAGIPLKIFEAAGYGLPCVITPLLARQLGWAAEEFALVGKDADEFAARCAQLYTDPALWESIRRNSLRELESQHSIDAFAEKVRRIVEDQP